MLLSRIFAVFAAALLVASFGLIMLAPYDLPLVQGMTAVDPTLLRHFQHVVVRAVGSGVWGRVITPLLARPIWLIPLSLGVVCVGVATTANLPAAGQRKRRRS